MCELCRDLVRAHQEPRVGPPLLGGGPESLAKAAGGRLMSTSDRSQTGELEVLTASLATGTSDTRPAGGAGCLDLIIRRLGLLLPGVGCGSSRRLGARDLTDVNERDFYFLYVLPADSSPLFSASLTTISTGGPLNRKATAQHNLNLSTHHTRATTNPTYQRILFHQSFQSPSRRPF